MGGGYGGDAIRMIVECDEDAIGCGWDAVRMGSGCDQDAIRMR